MSSFICRFTGTAKTVELSGEGQATLLEPDFFAAGQGQVELSGATLYVHSPGSDTPAGGPNLTFSQWQLLQPVNMQPSGPFNATYKTHSAGDHQEVTIELNPGGDNGWFQGQDPGAGQCATKPCEIRWGGNAKDIRCPLPTGAVLTNTMPMGSARLGRVILRHATGELSCPGKTDKGTWTKLDWQRGTTGALRTDPLKLTEAGFLVHVENDASPLTWMRFVPPAAGVLLLMGVLALGLIVWRKRGRARTLLPGPDLIEATPATSPPAITEKPVRIFLSYSHKDDELRAEFVAQIRALERAHLVTVWHDRRIVPGTNWLKDIHSSLEQAQLVVLLVSADFIDSDYCVGKELARALELQDAGRAKVVPVIVRSCVWKELLFAADQALPKDGKPVCDSHEWPSHDEAWVDVVEGIKRAALSLRK